MVRRRREREDGGDMAGMSPRRDGGEPVITRQHAQRERRVYTRSSGTKRSRHSNPTPTPTLLLLLFLCGLHTHYPRRRACLSRLVSLFHREQRRSSSEKRQTSAGRETPLGPLLTFHGSKNCAVTTDVHTRRALLHTDVGAEVASGVKTRVWSSP